ncbi:hypothetical protein MFLAVUS_005575 [Mucor flavus]|uniref:Uncharacterized protein n=1 Tax=Mucor flavus TaxID=439312 RepID=A0ABP9YZ28_9FUNG
MKPQAVKFVNHLISLVRKEMTLDQKETEKLLSGSSNELQRKGVAVLNLTVLRVGDIVALKEYNFYYDEETLHYTGIIVGISKWCITLCLSDADETTSIASSPKLIERFKSKNPSKLVEVLFGSHILSEPKDMTELNFKDTSLNEYQKDAIRFVLGSPEISLIHGPPAIKDFNHTGKTHTLIEVVRQLVEDGKKVLVCGPSHVSVDNLAERYAKHDTDIVRIGHPAKVSPGVVRWTLDVLCSGANAEKALNILQEELQKLSRKLRTVHNISEEKEKEKILKLLKSLLKEKVTTKKMKQKMNAANVVFSTLNASGSSILRHKVFDVVIIDEVGQSTEPDCWVALSKAKKAILSGDHLQLPPTVKTQNTAKSNFQGMSLMNDLSYTLFDRLISMYGGKIKKLLSIQYRMHEKIMMFSSQELYKNKLIADKSVARHILQDLPHVENTAETRIPIIMIDTSDNSNHHESKGAKMNKQSTANDYEVKVIVSYIRKLLKDGLTQKDIAVITPYKAQVTKLLLAMGDKWIGIEVGTVDGFQGREKEAIILSLVRSNKRGEVGFLAEKRRLNAWYQDIVPISREIFTLTGDLYEFLSILSNQTDGRNFSKCVKTLQALDDINYRDVDMLNLILRYFPSLRILDLSRSDYEFSYLQSITDRDTDTNIINLEKVLVGEFLIDQPQYKAYFDCIYSLRHTLPYLELSNLNHEVRNSKKPLCFLKEFTNLTEISITNLEHAAADEELSMFSVLESIPEITRFSIENDFEDGLTQNKPTLGLVYSNLKEVAFRIPSFNDSHMKYVLSHFPKRLKKFDLTITKVKAEDWIQKNDQATIRAFIAYLVEVDDVYFSIERFAERVTEIDTIQSTFTTLSLEEYWPFIFDIVGRDQQLSSHISIRLEESNNVRFENISNISIKRNKQQVQLNYILNLTSLLQQNPDGITQSIDNFIPLPSQIRNTSLDKSTIESIEIISRPPFSLEHIIPVKECIQLLKSILQEYSKLSYLHLAKHCKYSERYCLKFGSKLEDIQHGGPYDEKTYHDTEPFTVGQKRYTSLKSPTIKNLTFALIKTSALNDFKLKAITILLPNIKYLKIHTSIMKWERNFTTIFNLYHMHNMKAFVLDLNFLKTELQREVIVRVENAKQNATGWYRWSKPSKVKRQLKPNMFELCNDTGIMFGAGKIDYTVTKVLIIKCFDVNEITLLFDYRVVGKLVHP